MTESTDQKHSKAASSLSFKNTEVAFSSKSNSDLKKAKFLFKMLANKSMMMLGKYATNAVLALHLPVKGLIRATIFNQFCGGESIPECADTTKVLDKYGIGTILDYSVEGKDSEADFQAAFDELILTLQTASGNKHIPFCVFKISGLESNSLLEKISDKKELSSKEKESYTKLKDRVNHLCKLAYEGDTPILIDAEESWIQPAIDDLAMEMIAKYNNKRPIVYNTLQMYRHDRLAHLKEAHAICKQKGVIYAVKVVRGAYMEKERARAIERGYPSPIQPDKASTDRDFDLAVAYALDHIASMGLCCGTHNEHSSKLLAEEMIQRNMPLKHPHIYFAQLYGMSDHISFNLSHAGYNVAKYVPYGPIREVMPYLIRRAEENTSVAGQTSRELNLIISELKRRKLE